MHPMEAAVRLRMDGRALRSSWLSSNVRLELSASWYCPNLATMFCILSAAGVPGVGCQEDMALFERGVRVALMA